MNKNFIVIEDSSKNVFGGGQKISLLIMDVLCKNAQIILFDTNATSLFAKQSKSYIKDYYVLHKFGNSKRGFIGKLYKLIEFITLPLFLLINTIIIVKATKNIDNKVLYAATKKSLVIAYILTKLVKCNFIYHDHLIERNGLIKFILRKILKKAKFVIAVSDAVQENINLPNVTRIYNPVRLGSSIEAKELYKEVIVVGFFGSLIKIKGLKYFLDSYEYLEKKSNVEYWVFGDGPDKIIFDNYSNDNIKFKGFTNNVLKEMEQIDVLCFPSIIEESLGMVILEAFVSGVPVITTNIGGQAELVINGYNGLLVPVKNAKAIAVKISYIINNGDEYSRLSKNAILSSKKFNYNEFKQQIQKMFDIVY
jgi:glycosyltransferase involved in cell wall biosynthesis